MKIPSKFSIRSLLYLMVLFALLFMTYVTISHLSFMQAYMLSFGQLLNVLAGLCLAICLLSPKTYRSDIKRTPTHSSLSFLIRLIGAQFYLIFLLVVTALLWQHTLIPASGTLSLSAFYTHYPLWKDLPWALLILVGWGLYRVRTERQVVRPMISDLFSLTPARHVPLPIAVIEEGMSRGITILGLIFFLSVCGFAILNTLFSASYAVHPAVNMIGFVTLIGIAFLLRSRYYQKRVNFLWADQAPVGLILLYLFVVFLFVLTLSNFAVHFLIYLSRSNFPGKQMIGEHLSPFFHGNWPTFYAITGYILLFAAIRPYGQYVANIGEGQKSWVVILGQLLLPGSLFIAARGTWGNVLSPLNNMPFLHAPSTIFILAMVAVLSFFACFTVSHPLRGAFLQGPIDNSRDLERPRKFMQRHFMRTTLISLGYFSFGWQVSYYLFLIGTLAAALLFIPVVLVLLIAAF